MRYLSPLTIETIVIGMVAALKPVPAPCLCLKSVRRECYRRAGLNGDEVEELDNEAWRRELLRREIFAPDATSFFVEEA